MCLRIKLKYFLLVLSFFCNIIWAEKANFHINKSGSFIGLNDGRKMLINDIDLDYQEYNLLCDTAIVNKDMTRALLYGNISIKDKTRKINCKQAELFISNNNSQISFQNSIVISKDSLVLKGECGFFDSKLNQFEIYNNAELFYFPHNLKIEAGKIILNQEENSISTIDTKNIYLFDSLYFHHLKGDIFTYKSLDSLFFTEDSFKSFSAKHNQQIALPLSNKLDGCTQLERYLDRFKNGFFRDSLQSSGKELFICFKKGKKSYVRGDCHFNYKDSSGSKSILKCDSVIIKDNFNNFELLSNVNLTKDSLSFSANRGFFYQDSKKFRVIGNPVVSMGKSILLSDSVFLWCDDNLNPQKSEFHSRALFRQENYKETPQDKNIISGDKITIYWKDNDLNFMRVNSEASSLYFLYSSNKKKSVKDRLLAVNFVTGDSLRAFFQDNSPVNIKVFGGSSGDTFAPQDKSQALDKIKKVVRRTDLFFNKR